MPVGDSFRVFGLRDEFNKALIDVVAHCERVDAVADDVL